MTNKIDLDKQQILNLIKNFEFEDAVSYRVHSRIFEILSYLSFIDKEYLTEDVRTSLDSIEELSRNLFDEIHLIIENFCEKKHEYI